MFHNPENGFCVLRVKLRGQWNLVTAGRATAWITASECVQGRGIWVSDRIHGSQFKAALLWAAPPIVLEGTERHLGPGMITGTGPVYPARLVRSPGVAKRQLGRRGVRRRFLGAPGG